MFPQIIDRLGSILGLSNEEAMSSDLVKELCIDLVKDHLLIINSEKKKFFPSKMNPILPSNLLPKKNDWLFSDLILT